MNATERLARTRDALADIRRRIDNHPLNTYPLKDAREVVAEHRDAGADAVDIALSERRLPSAARQGKALVLGVTSLWHLNHQRRRLENRISKHERS